MSENTGADKGGAMGVKSDPRRVGMRAKFNPDESGCEPRRVGMRAPTGRDVVTHTGAGEIWFLGLKVLPVGV